MQVDVVHRRLHQRAAFGMVGMRHDAYQLDGVARHQPRGFHIQLVDISVARFGSQCHMFLQFHFTGIVENMINDIAMGVINDIVGFPIIDVGVGVEVVPHEIVQQGLGGTELAHGQDVGFHIIHQDADALVLALGCCWSRSIQRNRFGSCRIPAGYIASP